jgi:uncharacterized membrane protein YhaH (DUF805 family)
MDFLFSSKGRVGRLAYLGGLAAALTLTGIAVVTLAASTRNGMSGGAILGLLLGWGLLLASCWSGAVVAIKRLHDLGHSGLWTIPIYGLSLATSGLSKPAPTVSLVLAVVQFCILLYLVFAPGMEDDNDFGPSSRRTTIPTRPGLRYT